VKNSSNSSEMDSAYLKTLKKTSNTSF